MKLLTGMISQSWRQNFAKNHKISHRTILKNPIFL
jgi:hypothetical protein